MKFKIFLVGV